MRRISSKKKYLIRVLVLVLAVIVLAAAAGWGTWESYNRLVVNRFQLESAKVDEPIRMVVLSDLHDHEFGVQNEELAAVVKAQSPDLVLLVGDFMNEDSDDAHVPCEVIRQLKEIAPVYFALGNHEIAWQQSGLIPQLEASGAVVLEQQFVDIEVKGNKTRLGGMYEYAFGLNGNDEAEAAPQDVKEYLEEFQSTDRIKVMMSHRPDSFALGDASSYWDIDLVISGHNHGGQVVLPFLGGLYGGDQGWFPEYVHGMYQLENYSIFVTSGLGSHGQVLPQFNNPPEIAVVEIK